MGLSSAVSRGHMRPFGGRSPPFLVATLCVGLCVLAVSYWRLGIQYNDLEEQLRRLIQKKDSLEANESFINKQLELREENFSEAKVSLQKKEQELIDLRKKFDEDVAKLKETQKSLDDLKQSLAVFKTESQAKETSLQELRDRNSALEKENAKLKTDYTEVKTKLDSAVATIAAAAVASKSDKKESHNEAANAPVKSNAEQAQINLDRAQSTNVIQPPPDNHNKYGKNDGVSPSDENGVKHDDKNSLSKPSSDHEQHPQEQIQKPKIDPVVKFLKNSDQNTNNNDDEDDGGNGGGGNPPGSKQQAKPDLRENNNNYVDDEKDGAVKPDSGNFNNNMDDKDSVLDSNNFEENI